MSFLARDTGPSDWVPNLMHMASPLSAPTLFKASDLAVVLKVRSKLMPQLGV